MAERTSVAETCAPSRRAVAIACSPATPTPITKTRAAVIVPAAVIIIGKARPKVSAAAITALYPARLDWLESTSMLCARVMRGMNSIASASIPVAA